jgi:hypothetical protein
LTCSVAAAGLAVGWLFAAAAAQPPPPIDRPKLEEPIQYVGPDTYILLDSTGRSQPLLGMTYEDFMAAWKRSQQIETQVAEPRFTIEEVQIYGAAKEDHAELDVTVTIRLITESAVEIPLGMARGILREQPRWKVAAARAAAKKSAEAAKPAGSSYVEFVPERGGFVAGLRGEPDEQHRLTLRLFVPLDRDANQTSLPLNLPRALVSKLSVEVPSATAAAVNDGSLVSREKTEHGGTRLTVAGPAGDFRLTWSTAEPRRPELATVLSATGAIAISIDGHSIRSDARLTVRSYGGSFDRFRVRLPPGAQLVQQDRRDDAAAASPSYRITVEGSSSDSDGRTSRPSIDQQIVVVELPERQAGPVEVNLATEQPLGDPPRRVPAGTDAAVELAGFEVLGAVRQFGDVALGVADDWQLRWDLGPNVRQIERNELFPPQGAGGRSTRPGPGTRESIPTAAFQYDRAPWSLQVRIVERQFRIHATPNYVLEFGSNEARLRVGLTYQVPGARAFEFRVALNGWELTPEPIESDGSVDRDGVQVTRDGLLMLPLAQASPRRAEIAFVLRRELSAQPAPGTTGRQASAELVELPLPVPEADTVAAADLTVLTAPGIELRLDRSRSRGLSPTPVTDDVPPVAIDPPRWVPADGGQVLRYRAYLPDAVFAALSTTRPRTVETDATTNLAIDPHHVVAEQVVNYWVRNQPLQQLTFDVPEGWTLVDDEVEIVAGAAVTTPGISETDGARSDQRQVLEAERSVAADEPAQRLIRVPLPQPRLGRFQARLKFASSRPTEQPFAGPMQLELAGPSDGQLTNHHVAITSSPTLAISLDAEPASGSTASRAPADESTWIPVVRDAPRRLAASDSALELVAEGAATILPLVIRPIDPGRLQATSVERVWLQTWQAGDKVQERAAFRFRTTGSAVVVELPPGVASQEVEVLLDGQLADVSARDEGRVVIELSHARRPASPAGAGDARTLELRYRRTASISWLARQTLTPPQLAGMSTLGEVYWQLILPAGNHVLRTPEPLAPIDRWQWFDVFWGRQPMLGQAELEDWVGATHSAFVASPKQTAYLYSGLAPVASIELLTAGRWLIVLAASGAVLAVGCAWIYLPVVRRAWIGLLLAASIAALAVTYPVPAALLGQASVAGWILAVVALCLRGWLARPARRQPLTAGSTQLKLRPPSRSDSHPTPAIEITTAKTPATPISVPETD